MAESRGRILVVDDNRLNRMMLERALAQEGYEVATAGDGRQALERLAVEPFDVVLLDILMPELDGYETLARIKGDRALRHIPVIMISAVEEMGSVVRCIEMGATDYLPKPFNPALLRARINASLAEKRLRDLEREYLEQVGYVAEAADAVQAARFDPASLDRVAAREDALGQLARVFLRMAREVHLREQRLKQQLQQMHLDAEEMRRAEAEPLCVYLPMDRRQALVRGESLPEKTLGAALFADISGFTPLTVALAQELGLPRGAEELTRLLNQVYGVLIAEVHRYGGSVIGFSGDAITCWLDGDDGLRTAACALAMLAGMVPFTSVQTPAGTLISLAIRVAVAAGPVRRVLVGNPALQTIEVIAGQTLDRLARAQHLAGPGEVVAEPDLLRQAGDRITAGEWRSHADTGERFAVVTGLSAPVPPRPWPELPPDSLPDERCRAWLLPEVYRRLRSGTRQFLAELRPAVALFLRFAGIDYDQDAQAGLRLDAFLRWVQSIIDLNGGSLLQLTYGDKGSYLYAAFGAPVAHLDDEVRAVQAALALQSTPRELGFITGLQIGLAKGRMRTGAYGSAAQRTYGVLGDKTNLAARLMQAAVHGILCDEAVFLAAREHLVFEALPPIQVKGRTEPIPVYRPVGERARALQSEAELRVIFDRLGAAEQLALKVASVAGRSFGRAILYALFADASGASLREECLRSLEQQGLIERDRLPACTEAGSDATFSFCSVAIHTIAYEGMLFSQRRHLHRLAAEWYERTFQGDLAPHYAALAHHWRQAEEPDRAAEYLELAAQQARRAGDYEEAERYLRQSLELDARSAILSEGFYEPPPANWRAAAEYALARLERESRPEMTYHSLWHARDDVLPAARRLAAMMGIGQDETRLLEVAALYHDIGYTAQREEHERAGAGIAAQVLPGFHFSADQVAAIQGMILATQLPQTPRTLLEEILADADLDVLGREDYQERNQALRAELAALGTRMSDPQWLTRQLHLLQSHRYWTSAARALRDAGKEQNILMLRGLLAAAADREGT